MIYKVKARVIDETIGEFYRKLADGTVAKQRPDGEEIVASMKRAVLTGPGVAEWYEMCFCPTPLYHERQTQYDFYFTDMTTEPAKGYGEIQLVLHGFQGLGSKTRRAGSKFAALHMSAPGPSRHFAASLNFFAIGGIADIGCDWDWMPR